jgi:hypothetical protein
MPKFFCLFLIISQTTKCLNANKQALQSVMTFEETSGEEKSNVDNVERGRRASERINLSFPGTKW